MLRFQSNSSSIVAMFFVVATVAVCNSQHLAAQTFGQAFGQKSTDIAKSNFQSDQAVVDEIMEIRKQIGGVTSDIFKNDTSQDSFLRDELNRLRQSSNNSTATTPKSIAGRTMPLMTDTTVKPVNSNAFSFPMKSNRYAKFGRHSLKTKYNIDREVVKTMLDAAIHLEMTATELERSMQFEQADVVREKAAQIRSVYRDLIE